MLVLEDPFSIWVEALPTKNWSTLTMGQKSLCFWCLVDVDSGRRNGFVVNAVR